MRQRTFATVLIVAFVLLAGCSDTDEQEQAARTAVSELLDGWIGGDPAGGAEATDNPEAASAALTANAAALGFAGTELPMSYEIEAVQVADDGGAEVTYAATWEFAGAPEWTYRADVTVAPAVDGQSPLVRWDTSVLHPDLLEGQVLEATRSLAERAPILDAAGAPIFVRTPVVVVGVDPGQVTDLPTLASTLGAALGITAEDIVASVSASAPGQFVSIITLRRPDYDAVRPQIYELPGTVFREETRQLAPTPRFALGVLGRVGEATAEILEEAGPMFQPGDQLGLSGLQRAFQEQLSGEPGLLVEAVGPPESRTELTRIDPVPGAPVQVTLDSAVQLAADAAVATRPEAAHVVVLRPGTGEILAVASNEAANPANALVGQFPAGSSFKVVTGSALLAGGVVAPDTQEACPGTIDIGGRTFQNEDRFDLGTVPFTTAFAQSCNTTFTFAAQQLPPGALETMAASYGIGAPWELPIDVFSGDLPPPTDAVELAADAIGQGRVLVSPFAMAIVAATASSGVVPVPSLVVDGDLAGTAPAGPAPEVIGALQPMMREVVLSGTATELTDRGEVSGKTGTAEFGSEVPPQAHGWFVGFRPDAAGGLAFSVLVENGQSSGTSAVPLADALLAGLG